MMSALIVGMQSTMVSANSMQCSVNRHVGCFDVVRQLFYKRQQSRNKLLLQVAANHFKCKANQSLKERISKSVRLIRSLLKRGAFIDARNDLGRTPLMEAVVEGYMSTVEELINHGANLNLRDAAGNTALKLAIINLRMAAVYKLLDVGVTFDLQNTNINALIHEVITQATQKETMGSEEFYRMITWLFNRQDEQQPVSNSEDQSVEVALGHAHRLLTELRCGVFYNQQSAAENVTMTQELPIEQKKKLALEELEHACHEEERELTVEQNFDQFRAAYEEGLPPVLESEFESGA